MGISERDAYDLRRRQEQEAEEAAKRERLRVRAEMTRPRTNREIRFR